jgi:hypothetical protein
MGFFSRQGWRWRRRLAAGVLAAALPLASAAGCDSGTKTVHGKEGRQASAAESLRGVCPSRIVFQLGWFPEASDGPFYDLIGGQHVLIDSAHKKVVGDLIAGNVDTGVDLELRSGGPAVNYAKAADLMEASPDQIFAAAVDGDYATGVNSDPAKQPVIGVFAPLNHSPISLIFDPKRWPGFHSVADIGQDPSARVHTSASSSYATALVALGVLKQGQIVADADGSIAPFLAHPDWIFEGYVSNETDELRKDPRWHKPVKAVVLWQGMQLYDPYVNVISVLASKLHQETACLRKLVPILQDAEVDYTRNPTKTNEFMSKLNSADFYAEYPYPVERAAFAVKTMKQQLLMSDGPGKTVGAFDHGRVTAFITQQQAVAATLHQHFKTGLKYEDLYTGEFLKQGVGF